MITQREWTAGLNLRLDPWKLPPNALTVATNVVVKNGLLEPLKGLGSAETTGLGAGTWAWIWKLGATWLGSTTARYAVTWQTNRLIYVTAGGGTATITDGSTTANLGRVGPVAAPAAAAGAAGNITGTNLSWVVTYLDSLGQESAPSPPSGTVSPTASKVDLSSIPTSGTLQRKVYRTDASGVYRYVATLNSADTTYTDNTAVEALGDPLLTEAATVAPTLAGLAVSTHRAMLGGWNGNAFYRSNVGAPWSWSGGSVKIPEEVVGAFGASSGFVILTAAKPYLLTGTGQPATDTRLEPFPNNYGCSATRTICETDRGWVWWSPRGLVLFTAGGGFVELMRESFDATDIAGYSTSGMHATFADGEVLIFHSGGTLRCDLSHYESRGPVWTTSDQTAGATFRATDGTVYVATGNDVKKWATGAARTMTVRTADMAPSDSGHGLHVRSADIRHDGSATFQWYTAGTAHGSAQTLSPGSGKTKLFAATGLWDRGALEISSASAVREISFEATEVGGGT